MPEVVLPPMPFGSDLALTALFLGAKEGLEVDYHNESSLTLARADIKPFIWKHGVVETLKSLGCGERMGMPLIPGGAGGTDGYVLGEKLKVWQGGLGERERKNLFEALLNFLMGSDFPEGLDPGSVSISRGRNLDIKVGGDIDPPRLVISDALYELGKFHGIKETRAGRPSMGRVRISISAPYSALLYASLLAFQVAFRGGDHPIYTFMTLHAEPGTELWSLGMIKEAFSNLLKFTRKQGSVIYQDPEAYRLALIYRILGRYAGKIEAFSEERCSIKITSFSKSAKRFFRVSEIPIALSEVPSVARAMESVGLREVEDIASALSSLIIASMHLISLSENPTPYEALMVSLKSLARAMMEANLRVALDETYGIFRRLEVEEVRLRMIGKSADVEGDFLSVEGREVKREELFREMRERVMNLKRVITRSV
jgi:hypothetical protein